MEEDQSARLVTSDSVLVEVLNGAAGRGKAARDAATTLAEQLLQDTSVVVVPQTRDLLRRALTLYAGRSDKTWGVTDIMSMISMDERNIREVISSDHHFDQAGYSRIW